MTISGAAATGAAQRGLPVRFIANSTIAFAAFLGGFVIFEPAPYELFLCLLLGIWVLFGMRIPRSVLPLLILFTIFNFGGVISSFQIPQWDRGVIYVAVSYFLALSSVFFAIVILEEPARLRIIFRAYVVAAFITTMLGLIGYFHALPGFEIFTRYSRAMGAFQDPNVYGPFLVPPILYLVYGIMNRSPTMLPIRAGILLVLLMGLFLAFSRAAWGLAIVTGAMFYMLLVINEQTAKIRLKYIVLGVAGVVAVVLMLGIALQFDAVSDLFTQRLKVVQDYDGGREGRFARHWAGYYLALSKPLGIGPLEFGYIFTEDTHNIFVKALMDYGWIGFISLVTLFIWTLVAGFKLLFRQRPWLPYYQIAYVVFVGHLLIGNVIDIDHWRHFYLMTGIVWGGIALESRLMRERRQGLLMQARAKLATSAKTR
ncbi:MAG: O-antigen ligase family protein [Nitratireductor sp.]|nr:O-antigen ligase family protein [Nitratireductor sp.]